MKTWLGREEHETRRERREMKACAVVYLLLLRLPRRRSSTKGCRARSKVHATAGGTQRHTQLMASTPVRQQEAPSAAARPCAGLLLPLVCRRCRKGSGARQAGWQAGPSAVKSADASSHTTRSTARMMATGIAGGPCDQTRRLPCSHRKRPGADGRWPGAKQRGGDAPQPRDRILLAADMSHSARLRVPRARFSKRLARSAALPPKLLFASVRRRQAQALAQISERSAPGRRVAARHAPPRGYTTWKPTRDSSHSIVLTEQERSTALLCLAAQVRLPSLRLRRLRLSSNPASSRSCHRPSWPAENCHGMPAADVPASLQIALTASCQGRRRPRPSRWPCLALGIKCASEARCTVLCSLLPHRPRQSSPLGSPSEILRT